MSEAKKLSLENSCQGLFFVFANLLLANAIHGSELHLRDNGTKG